LYGNETPCGGRQDDDSSRARASLQTFLQDNAVPLQAIICGYVSKMGLATGARIEAVAADIFQDAVIETLAHAERFRPDMQPRPWFLAIAANILKRHRASYAKRSRFEVLIGNMASTSQRESEQDVLDLLMPSAALGPEQMLERREGARELLALVSPDDARLLSMALLEGWDAEALAQLLDITPGAARVRVHRALRRLREAWRTSEQGKEWSKSHE
jgi:RNA polymerase sigma factor (sigma-70 family)